MEKPRPPQEEKEITVFYKKGIDYEITINPDKQYIGDLARLGKVVQDVSRHMDKWKEYADFSLIPEVSEIRFGNKERGNTSRIHYHGTFRLLNDISVGMLLINLLPDLKKFADFTINELRPEYWINQYINKQQDIMLPLCKKFRVPYAIRSDKPCFELSKSGINGFGG